MTEGTVAEAYRLLSAGRVHEAVALIERAAGQDQSEALFCNAMWKLIGELVPRDLPGARKLLRRAATLGNINAALIEVALTANGSGAPADWAGARSLLEKLAKDSPVAATQLLLLQKMALSVDGAPTHRVVPRKIGEHPDIFHIARLFSPEECLHVAQSAADLLAPATVIDPSTGRNIANPIRTSDGAVIGPTRETLVVQALNRRLAAVTKTDWRQGEALSVLRYQPGQQFRPHLDALPTTRNQRVRTVLVYLNDGFRGGETYFTGNDVRVTPRGGDAIIFDNVRPDGAIDHRAQHAGEPVTAGVKWLATRWIRARPFSPWTGPEVN